MNTAAWGFAGAAITAVLLAASQLWHGRKSGPTAAAQLVGASTGLLERLQSQVDDLERRKDESEQRCAERIEALEQHVDQLQTEAQGLRDEVAGLKAVVRMRKNPRDD